MKTLNAAFNRAERYAVILKNPVPAVELPKVVLSEREMFTPDEVKKLLDAAGGYKEEWFTLILMGFYTGARLGVMCHDEMENVHFRDLGVTYEQRKTAKKVRVPLVEELHDHLDIDT